MKKLTTRLTIGIVLMLAMWLVFMARNSEPKFSIGTPLPNGKVTPKLVTHGFNSFLLAPDGSLWNWGESAIPTTSSSRQFAQVKLPQRIGVESDWHDVAGGYMFTIALKNDGSLWGWGVNRCGRLALPQNRNATNQLIRISVETNWAQISVGQVHALALKTDGSLWAWGGNFYGQVGDGTISNKYTITQIGSDHDWKSISAGAHNTYALKRNGTLWGWGFSVVSFGKAEPSPVQIDPGTNWATISAGANSLLALQSNGSLWVGGQNAEQTAPDYGSSTTKSLKQVGFDHDWSDVYAGQNCFFARIMNGSWWVGGQNHDGQLGFPPVGQQITSPQRLPFDFEPWAFATGYGNTVLLTHDGILWTWGMRPGSINVGALNSVKDFVNRKFDPAPWKFHPFHIQYYLIDPTPHRLWELPDSIRSSLGKQTTNTANLSANQPVKKIEAAAEKRCTRVAKPPRPP